MNLARLLELLGRAADLTGDELAELQTGLAELLSAETIVDIDDETLAEVAGLLPVVFDTVAESEAPSIELLTELADATDRINVEDQARQEASSEAQALIDGLRDRVHGTETETDVVEGAEVETVDATDTETETEDAESEVEELEPVLAAARPGRPGRTPLARLNRNQPDPVETETPQARMITAAAEAGGINIGAGLDLDQLDRLVSEQAKRLARQQGPYKRNVARFTMEYPEDRRVSATDAAVTVERINRVMDSFFAGLAKGKLNPRFESVVAAGGLGCGPLPVRYDQTVVGNTDRVVAAAMLGMDGGRGGMRFTPPPSLADIRVGGPGDDAAIGVWTSTDDEAADPDSAGTWKPIQRVDCGTEQSVYLELVTARLRIGNLQGLTWPERVRAFIELAAVQYARVAETQLLNQIRTASTATTGFSPILGSARDLIAEWATAASVIRQRNRVARTAPVRVIAPEAARLSMLLDLDRQLPGDSTFGSGEAALNRALSQYGITVTWTPDLQVPGAVGGLLPQVPTKMSYALFLEGEFVFLDGVNLDFGFQSNTPIRDSQLNAVNDHELFMEGGEVAVKFGSTQSLWVTTNVCPTGGTASTVDIDCTPGS